MMIRLVPFGGKVGGGWVKRDRRWGRECARMWMKRFVQSLSFDSSSSVLISAVIAVVIDLRLSVIKSLTLGLGIGEPVSILLSETFHGRKRWMNQTNPYNLLIIPGCQNLDCYVQPVDDKSASIYTIAWKQRGHIRKSSLAYTRRSIDLSNTSPRNSGRYPWSRRYCII